MNRKLRDELIFAGVYLLICFHEASCRCIIRKPGDCICIYDLEGTENGITFSTYVNNFETVFNFSIIHRSGSPVVDKRTHIVDESYYFEISDNALYVIQCVPAGHVEDITIGIAGELFCNFAIRITVLSAVPQFDLPAEATIEVDSTAQLPEIPFYEFELQNYKDCTLFSCEVTCENDQQIFIIHKTGHSSNGWSNLFISTYLSTLKFGFRYELSFKCYDMYNYMFDNTHRLETVYFTFVDSSIMTTSKTSSSAKYSTEQGPASPTTPISNMMTDRQIVLTLPFYTTNFTFDSWRASTRYDPAIMQQTTEPDRQETSTDDSSIDDSASFDSDNAATTKELTSGTWFPSSSAKSTDLNKSMLQKLKTVFISRPTAFKEVTDTSTAVKVDPTNSSTVEGGSYFEDPLVTVATIQKITIAHDSYFGDTTVDAISTVTEATTRMNTIADGSYFSDTTVDTFPTVTVATTSKSTISRGSYFDDTTVDAIPTVTEVTTRKSTKADGSYFDDTTVDVIHTVTVAATRNSMISSGSYFDDTTVDVIPTVTVVTTRKSTMMDGSYFDDTTVYTIPSVTVPTTRNNMIASGSYFDDPVIVAVVSTAVSVAVFGIVSAGAYAFASRHHRIDSTAAICNEEEGKIVQSGEGQGKQREKQPITNKDSKL